MGKHKKARFCYTFYTFYTLNPFRPASLPLRRPLRPGSPRRVGPSLFPQILERQLESSLQADAPKSLSESLPEESPEEIEPQLELAGFAPYTNQEETFELVAELGYFVDQSVDDLESLIGQSLDSLDQSSSSWKELAFTQLKTLDDGQQNLNDQLNLLAEQVSSGDAMVVDQYQSLRTEFQELRGQILEFQSQMEALAGSFREIILPSDS